MRDGAPVCSTPDYDSMIAAFNEEAGTASYMTWYCRLLTAGHLKLHKEEFSPFIDDGVGDVDAFCAREVEPIGKECEQVRYGSASAAGHICNFRLAHQSTVVTHDSSGA